MKGFHDYKENELSIKECYPKDLPWEADNFLALIHYDFNALCEPQVTRVEAFNTCYEALVYCYQILLDIEKHCDESKFRLKCGDIEIAMDEILRTKTDISVSLGIASFEFDDISLTICSAGYWNDAIRDIIGNIKEGFECYDPAFYMDPNEDKFMQAEAFATEKVKICDELLEYDNIREQSFVDRFYSLCKAYDEFFNEEE